MSFILREAYYVCEPTSLIQSEEYFVSNYVSHTKGRALAEGV